MYSLPGRLRRIVIALLLLSGSQCLADIESERDFFEAKIRPVLVSHCYECHSSTAKKLGGELLLDSRDSVLAGGESGAAVEPGDPGSSLLVAAIRYEGLEMPPSGKLPDESIADFEEWIRRGAYDPRTAPVSHAEEQSQIDIEGGRAFWSFQRPNSHVTPAVKNVEWPQRKIDSFILARLENEGMLPTERADPRVLVRRVAFDLTGLPPTPEHAEQFVRDQSVDAYERLVDALLARPQFGERWARLWLDVSRYAEDQAHIVGNNDSLFYPNAYLYRDWVIQAWNRDLPFDEFVRLQLAADLFVPDDLAQQPALGFLGLGPKYYRRGAPEVMADEWEDRVDTVTRGLLGLTVACARCHDHKYDPIPTEDYYSLAGVFANTKMFNRPLDGGLEEAEKAADAMHVVCEAKEQADIRVHIRGDASKQGDTVPRGYPQILTPHPLRFQQGSGRRELAETIASNENPLAARVIVNRIWAQYFGNPIVSTPSNFGQLGGRPSHPRLLDDLAVRFMLSGWSMKWLHREIVLSATYQQSSNVVGVDSQLDPANRLLGRMNQRRLSIEMWRDAMLSVTNELDPQIGGESSPVSDVQNRRRSIYAQVSRLELNNLLQMFDFPDPNAHAAKRSETTTPLQKLFALNSRFMTERAERFVARLVSELPDSDPTPRIHRAFELVYSRHPSPEEISIATGFLKSPQHWTSFAHALLASNEMTHID